MKLACRLTSVAAAFAVLVSVFSVSSSGIARASNLFCGADATYVPWDAARNAPLPSSARTMSAIRVVLYTAHAATANALVTFITNDTAYQATIAGVALHAPSTPGGDDESDPVLVTFPRPLDVEFAYVDSFSLGTAAMQSCPSFVNQVDAYGASPRGGTALPSLHKVDTLPTMPHSFATVAATSLGALPALACGTTYEPARMDLLPQSDWSVQDELASYSTGRVGTTAVVAIAVDSNGKPLLEQIVRSSGNHITDTEALDQARTQAYTPARFLCTPVVSLLFMTFQQK